MIGARLKSAREDLGFSQQVMADLLGITRAGYARYENETSEPGLLNLKKICEKLQISSDWLLGIDKEVSVYTAGDAFRAILALKEAGASVVGTNLDLNPPEVDYRKGTPVVLLVMEDGLLSGAVDYLHIMDNRIEESTDESDKKLLQSNLNHYIESQLSYLADKPLGENMNPGLAFRIERLISGSEEYRV